MKILLANKYFYLKGGSEYVFFETAELLKKKGHEVVFISMQHPQNVPSEYEKYFVSNVDYEQSGLKNNIVASLKLLYSFEAKINIEELIKKEKPDIAHLHNIHHQISPSILHSIKKFNIPVVLTLHDYKMVCAFYSMLADVKICEACKNGRYYYCFLKACVKDSRVKSLLNTIEMYLHHRILRIYDMVDVFISPSRFLKLKLEEMGFKGNIVYLPNFVNLEDYKPQYDWQENSIVYFGRLSKEKGLFTLIEAMRGLEIKLKIIGEGPIKEDLKRRAFDAGNRNIEFLGYKTGEELKNEIRKSMFFILPSEWYENNPRSVIEAFALGKPVIGARIGGIPELVKDNETGLTFEPGNSEDLRSKIEYLINKPEKIVEMGKNAREFVVREFDAEKHYRRLMEIYNSVLGR
ncbi:MAG: group 1 glycosyl transferase [Flavobacteria bacterium RIFCSPLOWO2_12_FULL_35_11]|nr:MAG: group 1 glycosyl transferase [Flavobacteria bacterium RIFCSPLOWO2_12_FULL_35_11]